MKRTEGRYPDGKPAYSVVVGYDLAGMTPDKQAAAIAKLEALSTPADTRRIEEWVTAMHAGMKRRKEDVAGLGVILGLYTAFLRQQPADVAKSACMDLLSESEWFPSIAELTAACRARGSGRAELLKAVREWRPPTPEERIQAARDLQALELRERAGELERSIPMAYRIATPRSQWEGEYLAKAEKADEMIAQAKALEAKL